MACSSPEIDWRDIVRFEGLVIGVIAFLIIGIFHPIVIKGEYYFTEKIWPLFLLVGIAVLVLSCFVRQTILASVLGVLGCTCLWSILELKEQTKRVEKGWFPRNPKREPQQNKK
jgi:predicted membrane protein